MFTVGGSYARLFAGKALASDVILEVDAFFFALQHGYGFLQSTYRENYLVETIPINEYNICVWKYVEVIYGLFNY